MTWPAVFDGVGALVVDCSLDPDELVDKIPGLTWIAVKAGGDDVAPIIETRHCLKVWLGLGLKVGVWTYCEDPEVDVTADHAWPEAQFVVYDVESPYKADEGGHYEWSAELISEHAIYSRLPAAVTSYGAYKTSIDFAAFAAAGWPIFAQAYDSFTDADAATYSTTRGGPYPIAGVHILTRRLNLHPREAVYRPESVDA